MFTAEELKVLRENFEQFGTKAKEHFGASLEAASKLAQEEFAQKRLDPSMLDSWKRRVDTNWSRYAPEELVRAGEAVAKEIPRLVSRLMRFVRQAPLLSDADLTALQRLSKELMAALRYRKHREWGPQVLHDGDVVLGTEPAGQDDSEWLSISSSQEVFRESFGDVLRIIDFLVVQDEDLPSAIAASRGKAVLQVRPSTAFIIMWIDVARPELEDVKEAIKDEFRKFGIIAKRADEIEYQDVITDRILNEIAASEFLIADLTGERPSVYYEIGYAHAIGKRPILYRRAGSPLHFDLSVHNCPEYKNVTDLREKLRGRLSALTNRGPVE
jgi:hypothetical protein